MSAENISPHQGISTSPEVNKLALVVGVNNSSITPPYRPSLKYAEKDAQDMASLLNQPECSFTLLVPALTGENATSGNIKQHVIELVRKREKEDFLLFYYAGHAIPIENDIYFITHDFQEEHVEFDPDLYLSMRWLWKVLYQSVGAGRVLLILDCCYAGNMVETKDDPLKIDLRKLLDEWNTGSNGKDPKNCLRLVLTATGYNNPAQEQDGHGLMTGYLLQALRGEADEALDKDGHVDIRYLHKYLQEKMPNGQAPDLSGKFGPYHCIVASYPEQAAQLQLTLRNLGQAGTMASLDQHYLYDIALSYADEDRNYATALAEILRERGVKVFFDQYEKPVLWGKDLYTHLSDLYQNKAHYCVVFLSKHYAVKVWTKHELKAAQARALSENKEYILPLRLDSTEIPSILHTTAYLDWHQETIEGVANIICEKLGKVSPKTKEQLREEAIFCLIKKDYEGALALYQQASHIDPTDTELYIDQSYTLDRLDRQEESLAACEHAIRLDPGYALAYYNKGDTLIALERYEEALDACEQAIRLDPKHLASYISKGVAFSHLNRDEEALDAYEQAIQRNPRNALAHHNKAVLLDRLGKSKEAQLAYIKAKQLGHRR